MAFCSFSKDVDNTYTSVENKFITKYLPEADGLAVKVYLYGLFLCQNSDADFGVRSMAEVLKTDEEQIKQAFAFWEDYDLVEILSQDPFTVRYLPVKTTSGKPKKVHYEQYADFNKEMQRKMQQVNKFISANDYRKYMRFLEENAMQPHAFLLVTEYCINTQGENVNSFHIINKAEKLVNLGLTTYDQIEKALSNYNKHERNVTAIMSILSITRSPDESDYALYAKWTENLGFSQSGIVTAAKKMKRGSMPSLDMTLEDLAQKGKIDTQDIEQYLGDRERLANLTFRIASKLGVKVQNPTPYIDEYVEKWYNYGFEESSLLKIALLCLKTYRNDFDSMHGVVNALFRDGVVSVEGVKAFFKTKNDELKLLTKIQSVCDGFRKSESNLSLLSTWHNWNFSDEMILEAAKQSAFSSNPIPYMNKILSNWKQSEIFSVQDIPLSGESRGAGTRSTAKSAFVNPAIEAVNAKSDRERYYALLREKAQSRADKYVAKANENARFKELCAALSKMELSLAKAEVFDPKQLPALEEQKTALLNERKEILDGLGIRESDLVPQPTCKKCGDTGYTKSGAQCTCYKTDLP